LTASGGFIASQGSETIQASSMLSVYAVGGITLNTLAASLEASNFFSGNISITQTFPAQILTITGAGLGVVNNAFGGSISLTHRGDSIIVGSGSIVQSNNGAITLAAVGLQIDGTVNSGTAATTLASPGPGLQFDVGTKTSSTIRLTQG